MVNTFVTHLQGWGFDQRLLPIPWKCGVYVLSVLQWFPPCSPVSSLSPKSCVRLMGILKLSIVREGM